MGHAEKVDGGISSSRIRVTFEESTASLLAQLAHKADKTLARIVRELALEALELREDLLLSKLAKKRDKRTYSHEEAWK